MPFMNTSQLETPLLAEMIEGLSEWQFDLLTAAFRRWFDPSLHNLSEYIHNYVDLELQAHQKEGLDPGDTDLAIAAFRSDDRPGKEGHTLEARPETMSRASRRAYVEELQCRSSGPLSDGNGLTDEPYARLSWVIGFEWRPKDQTARAVAEGEKMMWREKYESEGTSANQRSVDFYRDAGKERAKKFEKQRRR